jgi:RNA polymerase sigma factor (sigma-70 family)
MRFDKRQGPSLAQGTLLHFLHLAEREGQRYGLTYAEAQDCAMDLVVRLVLCENHVSPEASDFAPSEAWFARCARNAAINAYHKRQRRREVFMQFAPSESNSDPVATALEQCGREHLEKLLLHLDEEPRLIFIRCHLVGDSIGEIAHSLGKTPNAVRLILTRCRRRLRALLASSEVVSNSSLVPLKNKYKKMYVDPT